MKENTCMNITGKRPMPMLRNIDVINGIAERCREISLISTEIDTLCEMKQQNILDLPDSDERGLIEDVIAELAKTVFLLNKLSDYYIDRFADITISEISLKECFLRPLLQICIPLTIRAKPIQTVFIWAGINSAVILLLTLISGLRTKQMLIYLYSATADKENPTY